MKNYCINCKKEINDSEAKFCPDCGTLLTEKPQDNSEKSIENNKKVLEDIKEQRTVKYCEKCEKEIDDLEAKFCLDCGTPLSEKRQDNDGISVEDNKKKSELDRIKEQSLKSIVLDEIVNPVMKKLSEILVKLNIGVLRILLVLAYLFVWWGVSNLFATGLTMVAGCGIFTYQMVIIVSIIIILFCLICSPAIYIRTVLKKKAKQEIEQGNVDIHKKSLLNTIGKVARIICLIIGGIVLIIGLISGIYTYGLDSLVLLNLTGCCFWLGAECFFSGLEAAFRTIEELSQDDDIQNEKEAAK